MEVYESFYRRFGIRKSTQITTPPLPVLAKMNLPKRSILHFVGSGPLQAGPASDEFIFRNVTKPIMVGHITAVGDTKGMPRRVSVAPDPLVRNFHLKNRRYKLMRSLEGATRDDNTIVVYNYSLIPRFYRYVRSYYSEYYKWWNIQAAVWKNIAEVSKESDRHQFLLCSLPTILPGLADLRLGSTTLNQQVVKVFSTPEKLLLLELWKWFGKDRQNSVLAFIPRGKLNKINFIFQESGKWFVMNLGVFESWRAATKEELALDPEANAKGLAPETLQKYFLRLMMTLFEVRTVVVPEITDKKNHGEEPIATVTTLVDVLPVINKATGAIEAKTQTTSAPIDAEDEINSAGADERGEDIKHTSEIDKKIDEDLEHLETINQAVLDKLPEEDSITSFSEESKTLEDGIMDVCDKLADSGMLSAGEYRRFKTLSTTYKNIVSPDGKTTLDKFITIPPEVIKMNESPSIPDISTVIDKTMLKSSLLAFDQRYIKEVMAKDVAGMVMQVQNAGIVVTGYEVERIEDILGAHDFFTVNVVPVDGARSTWPFRLPALEEDGTYRANGVKYRMRKQRGDLPIRKIAPDRVALTSYYAKVFVNRSSKRVNNYGEWLRNLIMERGLDINNTSITDLHPSDVFDNTFACPRLYSTLAMGFRGLTLKSNLPTGTRSNQSGTFELSLDHTKRKELYGEEILKLYEKDGSIVIGVSLIGDYLVLDKNDTFYIGQEGNLRDYGNIEELLDLPAEKAPIEFAELRVMGRTIPIGVVLGYELGLEKLIRLLRVTPRRVPAGARVNLEPEEYSLVFSDETLVFSKDDKLAAMVLGGFNEFHRLIRGFSVFEFDQRGVYLNVLETRGSGTRYLREIDLLYQLFVDPITRDLLVEMKEPVDFRGLLMRSCEMLLLDHHPDELDPAFMRIKGYERMAGAVYSEITKAIRIHNGRPGKSSVPIDLKPHDVWRNISQDPSNALVSDINPIQNLKEIEAVTYTGVGGRNSRSMTKNTRAYHPNDMGTISESTVDSSDVAINTYTSADPQFTSLRGISRRFDIEKTGATALLSTSALISPAADRDDPKRVNFIGIQHSHGIACSGYTQSPTRTGYEQILAHRTGDLFALTAKQAGKVISVNDDGIVVEYEDGETKGYELGRRFGNAAGLVIPHSVVSALKEGQKFKEGDLISYNDGFFEKDLLNPSQAVWKAGILVKTVLLESTSTLEDSSAISQRAASLLSTKITKVKTIVVNFNQSIKRMVKVGDNVESENILCMIEDELTAGSDIFDDESLDTLRILSAQSPQAKTTGVIEKIEVFYHGEKEDMSETLRAIANLSDRELVKKSKALGKKAFTGQVDGGFRTDGEPLPLDNMAILIYITGDVAAGEGDKGVFCNQMKTVFGKILPGEITTESGKKIDAVFGRKSIDDRIVTSPDVIGTTNTLLDVIGKLMVKTYRSK